jgi:periplasmic nitrate reductase NapD
MAEEVHITSLVVHVAPARVAATAPAIAAVPGAQVHAASGAGKLVVTLEASCSEDILSGLHAIQHMDGVLSAVLVYECVDTLEAMNEEMADADDTQGLR